MSFDVKVIGLKTIQNKARRDVLIDEPLGHFFERARDEGIALLHSYVPKRTGELDRAIGGFVDSKALVPRFAMVGVRPRSKGGPRQGYFVQVTTKHGTAQPFVRQAGDALKGRLGGMLRETKGEIEARWASRASGGE